MTIFLLFHWLMFTGYRCSSKVPKNDYGYEYLDEYNYSDEEMVEEFVPEFITQPTQYMAEFGGSVRLECQVKDLGPTTISWRKIDRNESSDTSYIAVGPTLLVSDPRLQIMSSDQGSDLSILLAKPEDEGEYQCQVFSHPPVFLTHSLHLKVMPRVSVLGKPESGVFTIREGEELALICQGEGFPAPDIYWKRKYQRLDDGNFKIQADQLIYKSASRGHSGVYVCSGENGYGPPAQQTVEVVVVYKPDVVLDANYLHKHGKTQLELVCHIQANPVAKVLWTGLPDQSITNITTSKRRSGKHVLLIEDLSKVEIGEIGCQAENRFGMARAVFQSQHEKAGTVFQTQQEKAGTVFQTQQEKAGTGFQTQHEKTGTGFQTQHEKTGTGFQTQQEKASTVLQNKEESSDLGRMEAGFPAQHGTTSVSGSETNQHDGGGINIEVFAQLLHSGRGNQEDRVGGEGSAEGNSGGQEDDLEAGSGGERGQKTLPKKRSFGEYRPEKEDEELSSSTVAPSAVQSSESPTSLANLENMARIFRTLGNLQTLVQATGERLRKVEMVNMDTLKEVQQLERSVARETRQQNRLLEAILKRMDK